MVPILVSIKSLCQTLKQTDWCSLVPSQFTRSTSFLSGIQIKLAFFCVFILEIEIKWFSFIIFVAFISHILVFLNSLYFALNEEVSS